MSIINLKPTNPTPEEFYGMQSFGLQPYDREPNDYLRFVAKIFSAWRDPDENIINFDPYNDSYNSTYGETNTTLQATADKSITSYIDGFQISYNFTRLTTDADSTDLTSGDNIVETDSMVTYTNEFGETITINKAKYGEYHRFVIKAGFGFIDNQLIQIKEDTEWYFRVPDVTTVDGIDQIIDGVPQFELSQFLVDQTNVYSFLPNKRYKIILCYEYINQFESNSASIRFVTTDTAIDEPFLLLGTFSTNEYSMVHQTAPVNEANTEVYLNYINKPDPSDETTNMYYLRDIDNQYLDKKYMANHKNLFKHLQSQLLTTLTESKIANTFHVKTITEELDHSVSSGDFVYLNANENRWYPADVSRQDFDKVYGLYLRNVNEGTDLLFTSGIIEIDDTYKIINKENMILKNLIPGAEYFLVDDIVLQNANSPFIAPFEFNILNETFSISTTVIAKAESVIITMRNIDSSVPEFSITREFLLDYKLGEQRIEQNIVWDLTTDEKDAIPTTDGIYTIVSADSGLLKTESITFDIKLNMVQNTIDETEQTVVDDFYSSSLDITLPYTHQEDEVQIIEDVIINSADVTLETMNLGELLIGPQQPLHKLLGVLQSASPKNYASFGITKGQILQTDAQVFTKPLKIKLENVLQDLNEKLYDDSADSLGLNNKLSILGDNLDDITKNIEDLENAQDLLNETYVSAKMEFQSTSTKLQYDITEASKIYYTNLNTKKMLVTKKENLEQQIIAVNIKIDDLNEKKTSLEEAKLQYGETNVDINEAISTISLEIDTIEADITALNNEISNLIESINKSISTSLELEETLNNITHKNLDYKNNVYGVINLTKSDYDLTDPNLITQRLANTLHQIRELSIVKDELYTEMVILKDDFNKANELYTYNIINGILTFTETIQALSVVSEKETAYNTKNNDLIYATNKLISYREIRDTLIDTFNIVKELPKVELFAEISGDVPSDWIGEKLVTYTMLIDKPLTEKISFDFIYKEDSNDKGHIEIPIGSTSGTLSVYSTSFPNTYTDNGMPKWTSETACLNINKYNACLNEYNLLIYGEINPSAQNLFTLNSMNYIKNPSNPTNNIISIDTYNAILSTVTDYYDTQTTAEIDDINREIFTEKRDLLNLELVYKETYLYSLNVNLSSGILTVENYNTELLYLNEYLDYYTNTEDKLIDDKAINGSDWSLAVLNEQIVNTEETISSHQTELDQSYEAYQETLNILAVETEKALQLYTSTIETQQDLIEIKNKELISVQVIYNIFNEKILVLNDIYIKLLSIVESGIFDEWEELFTLQLNSFEYEDGLENAIYELLNKLELLPYSNFVTADTLDYTCSPNGLAYPNDLQPWIFSKSSGKISNVSYPGATSVGIALNNNTLILNIKHNTVGDISEFLNVYGNANDLIDQLTSVYYTKNSFSKRNEIISANANLNLKINTLDNLLINNKTDIVRNTNDGTISISTTLNEIELDTLDSLVKTDAKRECLIRLIYFKYFGTGSEFNPVSYLLEEEDSESSYYHTIGNQTLNNRLDTYTTANISFGDNLDNLITNINEDTETMKDLFFRKNPLLKDLDIISYILMVLPEPLINYEARYLTLQETYVTYVLLNLDKQRLVLGDDPNSLDDFENPSITDTAELIDDETETSVNEGLREVNEISIQSEIDNIATIKLNHDEVMKSIIKFKRYKYFYNTLKFSIGRILDLVQNTRLKYSAVMDYLSAESESLNSLGLEYYNRTDKLPNTNWDIFRITNHQRTKWNYTYLVLRIMGMQQELNNIIVGTTIQYSPINAELNELKIKKNAALTDGSETLAFEYQAKIENLTMKKNQFSSILDNYVKEFNVIQNSYNYTTITSEVLLTTGIVIEDLYMQDPDEYNLSYAFSSYPAYT